MSDSMRSRGGEEGETKVRRRGRLLMCDADESNCSPRVLISATPFRDVFVFVFFFFFMDGSMDAMVLPSGSSSSEQCKVLLRV